jgi:hypothetical protein
VGRSFVLFEKEHEQETNKEEDVRTMNIKILKGASILTAVLMVSTLFSTVLAGPVQPFNRWGYAYDNGGTPLDTQDIYAWIDGVSYGTDVTGTGADVGLFSIDCYGDDTTPDGVKTGGYNGDAVFYTHGDLTTTGIFFGETDSWIVGGFNVAAANLNEVAATPPLLKINNVASQANVISGIDDYVVIYNPSAGAVDLTAYELSIGGGAPIAINAGIICPDSTNPVAAGGWCAIDLTGLLSTTGNSITLAEIATGFIVDRVEYGAIAAEPENTMMNNAPNPAINQEILRQPAMGSDTNDCLVDFTTGPSVDHGGGVVVTYGPPAPTALRIDVVGPQDTATDCELTWTDEPTSVSYDIFRGPAPDAINFGAPIANVPQGAMSYIDPGAVGGSAEYYYCLKSVSAGGTRGESSATVGKFTVTYPAGWNAFGSPLEYFPDAIDAWGNYLSDWWLIDATSPEAIPDASALSTFDQGGQFWAIRTPATPPFVPGIGINSIEDGAMVYMDAANEYTWTGWPAEQIRTANFAGKAILPAPTTYRLAFVGPDVVLSWDPVVGADHYEVFVAASRNLENYNFAAGVDVGLATTWTDFGAAVALGERYYIVAAVDIDGDPGDSTYALGKYCRNFAVGWNAFTTPFNPLKYDAVDAWGNQLSDWKLIDATSPDAIPSASALSTFDQGGQFWAIRTPATPPFVPGIAIPPMGACAMAYLDAANIYCWRT